LRILGLTLTVWPVATSWISNVCPPLVSLYPPFSNQGLKVLAGTYTAIVSSFDPGVTSPYTLHLESALPTAIEPIPAEGAGLYSRTVQSRWLVISSECTASILRASLIGFVGPKKTQVVDRAVAHTSSIPKLSSFFPNQAPSRKPAHHHALASLYEVQC
jgi:hypothetical protein